MNLVLANVHCGFSSPIPNRTEFEIVRFWGQEKNEVSEKNLSGQGWKPKTNLSKICLGATSEGFESRPHWSEANALTTLPPLLTFWIISFLPVLFLFAWAHTAIQQICMSIDNGETKASHSKCPYKLGPNIVSKWNDKWRSESKVSEF